MKINFISFSDKRGGAAIAANKQYNIIRKVHDVKYIVAEKKSIDLDVFGPSRLDFIFHFILRCLSLSISKLQKTVNKSKHSLNIFSSRHVVGSIDPDADIIHLHWFNNETVSLRKLKEFIYNNKQVIIITLHDDWFFCGAEHSSLNSDRFIHGYLSSNKNVKGFDLDKWVFNRKLRFKKALSETNVIFTAPSIWMVKRAQSSYLLKGIDVKYIPNIIDVDVFKASPLAFARSSLLIPLNKLVICFGAIGGTSNYLKGYDLLIEAIKNLSCLKNELNIHLLIFGGEKKPGDQFLGFDVTYTGHVSDPIFLAKIYSASDVVVVPSRIESFGQVAAESLSCETPVVCFNNSGVAEIVDDGLSGYKAVAFEPKDLASKIFKILSLSREERSSLGKYGREKILLNYSSKAILPALDEIYTSNKINEGC